MGNHRFRLSDMIPNAWFYKLRSTNTAARALHISNSNKKLTKNTAAASEPSPSLHPLKTKPHRHRHSFHSRPRKSHYFSRDLHRTAKSHQCLSPPTCSPQQQFPSGPPTRKSPSPKHKTGDRVKSIVRTHQKPAAAHSAFHSSALSSFDVLSPHAPDFRLDRVLLTESSVDNKTQSSSSSSYSFSSCSGGVNSSPGGVIMHVDKNSVDQESEELRSLRNHSFPELELPRIETRSSKSKNRSKRSSKMDEEQPHVLANACGLAKSTKDDKNTADNRLLQHNASFSARFAVTPSGGVKLRVKSPKLLAKKKLLQAHNRRTTTTTTTTTTKTRLASRFSDSFAVVKSSQDPERDFRESMVEMIVENNIEKSEDLEELLACYLTLNADEYHDVIVHVFKQIWFDLARSCPVRPPGLID